VFGAVPESPSAWLLLLALLVVAAGAAAGLVARERLRRASAEDAPLTWRLAVLLVIALGAAGGAALLAVVSSGALGPERLQHVGAAPGPLALAVGLEVALGAAAVLLAPRETVPLAPRESAPREAEPSPPLD